MLKIISVVLGIVLVAIAAVLVIATTKPDTFRVTRSTVIKAPPDKIFPLISDFQQWKGWSPYEVKDPTMKRTFSGAASGKGAIYAWEGDSQVGQGRMEIAEASPPSKVVLNLDFTKPMEAHNIVVFTMEPKGDVTQVTWDMNGPTPYIGKIFHVLFNMDQMVGTDFEAGLANLKSLAEK
jgi:uncharacterized protein YndB with AHSA1/START domain